MSSRRIRRRLGGLLLGGAMVVALVIWRGEVRRPHSSPPPAETTTVSVPVADATAGAPVIAEMYASLFARGDGTGTAGEIASGLVPAARRVRTVAVAPEWLDRKHSPWFDSRVRGLALEVEVWPGETYSVRLDASDVVGRNRHVVRGTVPGAPGSRFLLAMADEAVAFSLQLDGRPRFGGVTTGAGGMVLYELDAAAAPPCAAPLPALPDADALAQNQARSLAVRMAAQTSLTPDFAPPGSVAAAVPGAVAQVDVLLLYTPEVSASATPSATLVARADLAIAEANDDYARSETRVQLRLVGLRQTSYAETAANATALDRLRQTGDGFMDEVHALRDELGADLVCLVVQRSDPSNIGIAYVLDSLADPERQFNDLFAFSVVQSAWLTGSNTFAHEIGHNLGCAHDRENSSSGGLFPYSYGYRFTGADSRTYRTIMAYQPGTSVSYFSNPRLTHPVAQRPLGVAAGLPGEADNATSINRAAWAVASYRSNRADPPARGRLYNVSTRAWVGTGDNVLIGGFYVGSPGPKQVLVRVRGPELTGFNVPDALLDPEVELVNQATRETVALNADWGLAPNATAIAATGLAPVDPREPAILVTLEPGGYTAIARGAGDTQGIALVEVFEIDGGSAPRLVNLSTRGFVDTGDRVMIGGLIVNGVAGETKRLLFRALGPSLADFGVANALFDPALRLYNEAGDELLDNDDWDYLGDTQQAQVQALGLAPTVRRESVLLVDLPPGLYTLIVRPFENDVGTESGVGLIEAYEISTP